MLRNKSIITWKELARVTDAFISELANRLAEIEPKTDMERDLVAFAVDTLYSGQRALAGISLAGADDSSDSDIERQLFSNALLESLADSDPIPLNPTWSSDFFWINSLTRLNIGFERAIRFLTEGRSNQGPRILKRLAKRLGFPQPYLDAWGQVRVDIANLSRNQGLDCIDREEPSAVCLPNYLTVFVAGVHWAIRYVREEDPWLPSPPSGIRQPIGALSCLRHSQNYRSAQKARASAR